MERRKAGRFSALDAVVVALGFFVILWSMQDFHDKTMVRLDALETACEVQR